MSHHIHTHYHFHSPIERIAKIMSAISDKIDVLTKSTDDATTRVQADIASLKQQVADLTVKVDQGGVSEADMAALDALKVKIDQLDPATPSTVPDDGTVPQPTPLPSDPGPPLGSAFGRVDPDVAATGAAIHGKKPNP